MKKCALFCAGWWPFLVFPFLLLLPLLFFKWHPIEQDVAANASNDLSAAGMEWAKVDTFNRGRDVLLTGTPPNEAAIVTAKELAESAYGVNKVEVSADVRVPTAPPSAPELNTLITSGSVVLRGTLKDQASIEAVVQQAGKVFGENKVINKLSVGDNVAAIPSLTGFFQGLAGKSAGSDTLSAKLQGNSLTLSGEVPSLDIKSSIGRTMSQLFSGEVNNQLSIAAPPPVERDLCQELVNELLASGKINFATGKSLIKEDSYALLQSIADIAKQCPDAAFEVAGHTDSTGNLESNMKLSESRAQAVVSHLTGLGLDANQFSAAGYGPNRPVGDNSTAEGRALNRRIEFKLKN